MLLDAQIINVKRFAESSTKDWSLFNPCIAQADDGSYVSTFRSSNYVIDSAGGMQVTTGGSVRNRMFFSELGEDYKPTNLREIIVPDDLYPMPRGMEDARLLRRGGEWWITAVAMESTIPVARLMLCKLNEDCTRVVHMEMLPSFDQQRPEKNWMMPIQAESKTLFAVYDGTRIVKDGVLETVSGSPELDGIRGTSHLLEEPDGTYVGLVHRTSKDVSTGYNPRTFGTMTTVRRDYSHYFARFDRNGRIFQISDGFQFVGPGVEFATGIADHGGEYLVSFGRDDVSSHLAVVQKGTVAEMLRDVGE